MGTAGTVTVDDSQGEIDVSGMQFAVDGYRIEGDAIHLANGMNDVRVGDGTSASANMSATIAVTITGNGGLDKTDSGKLVLTGTNTYTGGTTVSRGTLQLGDGATTGSISGDVTVDANGTLAFDRSDEVLFDGTISGAGTVHQNGSGTITLTGANTYSGGTVINDGVIEFSADANLGDASGEFVFNQGTLRITGGAPIVSARDFVLNGAATFDTTPLADLKITGDVTGAGSLTKTGNNGRLILQGDYDYTGVTSVQSGTLQFAGAGAAATMSGDVVNDAALIFGRLGGINVTSSISGGGQLFIDAGMLALTGSSNYDGTTQINAGTMEVKEGGKFLSSSTLRVLPFGGIVVDGDNSRASFVDAAVKGAGELIVVNGGSFESDTLELGYDSFYGATQVMVTGAGSRLTTSELLMGEDGVAHMTIEDAAVVTAGTGSPTERIFITSDANGSESRVRVVGAGSRLEVAGDLHLGYQGGDGAVELESGSSLHVSGSLHVGHSNDGATHGSGRVAISDEASADVQSVRVAEVAGSVGSVTIDDATQRSRATAMTSCRCPALRRSRARIGCRSTTACISTARRRSSCRPQAVCRAPSTT